MTDIFESNGRVNTGIDPQNIHPDRRSQYVALVDAQLMTEQAEANQKAADDAVVEAVCIHDQARAAQPRTSFMDLWRQSRG
jgi:hypothetical protein